MNNLDSILKSRDITLPTKVHIVKAMVFPVVIYRCESWTIKKTECERIDAFVVLEKTLESSLDCKEIQPVHPEGNQSWIFIGRTDVEAETPILWPPDAKNWLIRKDPDAGKGWRWEEKGTTKDEMVGWHHWLNGHEFEQTLGVGDGQGSLMCWSPWGRKKSDTTERLNWTELCELSFHDFYLFNSGLLVFSSLDCQVHVLKISSSKLWFAFNSLGVYSWWIKFLICWSPILLCLRNLSLFQGDKDFFHIFSRSSMHFSFPIRPILELIFRYGIDRD